MKPTLRTWDGLVVDASMPTVVEFYAPWCSHCQEFVAGFKRTALLLEDEVQFAAVNCERERRLCQHFQIGSYPTIRIYASDGQEDFNGRHTTEDLFSWVKLHLDNRVVPLNPYTFNEVVEQSSRPWLVQFSAGPWCGPCTVAKSRLRRLAAELKGHMMVGIVDCDSANQWCQQQGIGYYPYLRLYKSGEARDINYSNDRQYPVINSLDLISELVQLMTVDDETKWNPDEDIAEIAEGAVDDEFAEIRSEL